MTLNCASPVTPDRQRSAADVLDAAFRDVGRQATSLSMVPILC
jgi:hypothetical protein